MNRTSSSSFAVNTGEPPVSSTWERRCSFTAVAVKFRMKCLAPFTLTSLTNNAINAILTNMDDELAAPFTMPVPPGFPPPHGGDRVLFFRTHETEGGPGTKDHEDIMLRRVPREVGMRYRAAAGGRAMTHAQYLTALVELHAKIRERADGGDETARAVLKELGLQTVAV